MNFVGIVTYVCYESIAYTKGISFELTIALKVSRKMEFQIAELRSAVLAIANTLRCNALAVRYHCTSAWVTRVRDMNERALSREMHFLLNRMGLRRIARVFQNYRTCNAVVRLLGENIARRGMQDARVVSHVIRACEELNGK